jgi:hypothetical protein
VSREKGRHKKKTRVAVIQVMVGLLLQLLGYWFGFRAVAGYRPGRAQIDADQKVLSGGC